MIAPAIIEDKTPRRLASLSAAVGRFSFSLRTQLVVLTLIWLAVPVFLFHAFNSADEEKDALLLDAVRRQDVMIANALRPDLQHMTPAEFARLPDELARFATEGANLKLLYKPNNVGGEAGFFYVAAAPTVGTGQLAAERQSLVALGILDRLASSCAGNQALSERVGLPGQAPELLTSIAPIETEAGCWVLVVAAESQGLLGQISGRPYYERPAVRAALITYAALIVLAALLLGGIWRAVGRFRSVARDVDTGRSFAALTPIPELASMAKDLDRMVARLNETATLLRRSAEDNAHALKGPIATLRQLVDALRRPLGPERFAIALDALDLSLDKMDGLVRSARRLDVATADLLDLQHQEIDLSALIEGFAADHRVMLAGDADRLIVEIEAGIWILGREEMVETIIENLVDNALGFSPPHGRLFLSLRRQGEGVSLAVADEGPGVAPDRLEAIFERYYSERSPPEDGAVAAADHYGVGLWLVRQNATALGGHVAAENRDGGGLVVTVTLPVIRRGLAALRES